jgi:hypothetical protein
VGQKRRSERPAIISGLHPEADMAQCLRHVSKVPTTEETLQDVIGLQHQSAPTRLSHVGTGFGVMVAAGSGVRVTSEVDALFAAMSGSRRRDRHIVHLGAPTASGREDATGVKSGFWSLPTRMPE